MRCVVTGGAGFIGSHLVDRLVAEGHEVVALDSFATGRRENLAHHVASSKVSIFEADINDGPAVDRAMQGAHWVFHLAGLADIVPSIERPSEYHRANVDGTISVLESSRRAGVKRFVYAASSSCYGIPDAYPTSESAEPRPMYPYAFTKLTGERYVLHWSQVYGLPVVSLRLFNVYGPRSRTTGAYGAVFGVFLAQKLAGKPFTVVGDGSQSRDFTFVTDVARAFERAAASNVSGEAMNVGTSKPQSVSRLVELLGGDVVHLPKRPGEPDCTQADVSKIRSLLGWEAKVPFEDGVREMLANINLWKGAPVWTPEAIDHATRGWFEMLGKKVGA
jgi:UDP-glucose 4-epimerase